MFLPSTAPSPSAPNVVETTGMPAAQAVRILTLAPAPIHSGTTNTFERWKNATSSFWNPTNFT